MGVVELLVASLQLAASLLTCLQALYFTFFELVLSFEKKRVSSEEGDMTCPLLHCRRCKGTRARISVIVWIKCSAAGWISAATAAAVQSKETATAATAARSPWLPHTLHKGASASEGSPGRS